MHINGSDYFLLINSLFANQTIYRMNSSGDWPMHVVLLGDTSLEVTL